MKCVHTLFNKKDYLYKLFKPNLGKNIFEKVYIPNIAIDYL